MEYAARRHTCALMDDERVRCWGRNDVDSWARAAPSPRRFLLWSSAPIGLTAARGLAAGLNHSCAWRADGSAACWGRNASGQIGDGTLVDRLTPVPVPLTRGRTFSMAGGDHHTCAASTAGRIECWGQNIDGQVSVSADSFVLSPSSFTTQMHANLAAGSRYTILARAERLANQVGATNGWGANDAAQLGDLSESSSGLFISAGPMPLPVAVVAGIEHRAPWPPTAPSAAGARTSSDSLAWASWLKGRLRRRSRFLGSTTPFLFPWSVSYVRGARGWPSAVLGAQRLPSDR